MSFKLKGYLVILLLLALAVIVIWAPWDRPRKAGMPRDVFAAYEGSWQGKFWSYSIGGDYRDSFFQHIELKSITADSQVGVVVRLSVKRDTLARDSLINLRRGDSLLCIRRYEDGRRDVDKGYWADGQIFWRSQDIFGRVAHAYRERVKSDLWEVDGFTRTDRGEFLIQYGRALRR